MRFLFRGPDDQIISQERNFVTFFSIWKFRKNPVFESANCHPNRKLKLIVSSCYFFIIIITNEKTQLPLGFFHFSQKLKVSK
ncbi:MAG: hypothetical protein C5B59_04155 [Bacteroidetes bacterium]|nr:MAG: hypothetical protein C5B59_04155 [Bacteroidota bacterium]